jgi:hypothetical protein
MTFPLQWNLLNGNTGTGTGCAGEESILPYCAQLQLRAGTQPGQSEVNHSAKMPVSLEVPALSGWRYALAGG